MSFSLVTRIFALTGPLLAVSAHAASPPPNEDGADPKEEPAGAGSEQKEEPTGAGSEQAADPQTHTAEPGSQAEEGQLPGGRHELEELVVTAPVLPPPEASVTSSAVALDEEQLRRFETQDATQVLLRVPGVQVRGEDGMGLRPNVGLRGTSPERSAKVALTEDGILFGPAPYSAPAAYFFPMVDRMTGVEVVKGGAQLRYGPSALGGAINFTTASIPNGLSARLGLDAGQYGTLKAHARGGYGGERTGYLLEVLHVGTDGFKQLDGQGGPYGGDTGFDKNEVMTKWKLSNSPTASTYHELRVKLGLSTETSNETYLGLSDEDFRENPLRRYIGSERDQMRFHRGQVEISHTALVGDQLEIDTTAYAHKFTRDWFKVDGLTGADLSDVLASPDSARNEPYYRILTGQENSVGPDELLRLRDNYRYYNVLGIQSRLGLRLRTGRVEHEIEGGIRVHYDEVNRRHTNSFYEVAGATTSTLGQLEEADLPQELVTDSLGQTVALSLHAIDEIKIQKLTLSPGIRTEIVWNQYIDHLDPTSSGKRWQVGVLPGLGAHYAFTPELGVFSGVYRGFSPVSPQPSPPGAAEPAPESSIVSELGTRFRSNDVQMELVGFLNAYQNLTAICSESRGCDATNVGTQYDGGQANVYGLEVLVGYRPELGELQFPIRISYALTGSRFLTSFNSENPEWGDVRAGDELPYVPHHQGTIQVGIGREKFWSFDAEVNLVSESREIAGQGPIDPSERTDAAALLGLSSRFQIVEALWGSIRITNLFDTGALASRRPYGARPVAPRMILAGLDFVY